MNDAERLFNQTSRERKNLSHGAFAKKNKKKKKKCTMPSDYLTPAEKKKLNGEEVKYDLSKPMKWKEFRTMRHDLRAEYIKKLAAMGAGRDDISDMFGCTPATYSAFMAKNHKGEKFLDYKANSNRNNEEFIKWFCGEIDSAQKTAENKKEDSASAPEIVESEPPKASVDLKIRSGSLSFEGDARAVFQKALLFMDSAKRYEIKIEFTEL